MKLLIVEDELSLQKALCKGFAKLGYAVDAAGDGEEALERYYSSFYDVIVLDLNLPKLDGIEVLKEIRKEDPETRIIILSARSEVEDKVLGLDLGANDYLAKPFHFRELEARVRALLRRDFSVISATITVSGITVDTALKKVFCRGKEIPLTRKEYGILEYLFINRGRVVSNETLLEHVWDSNADLFSNALRVHIASIRKKLPGDIIKNVRGQGYYVE
ncbi:MAG TPA: response regulator transcription factor [Bacillota bacterium]|nr:response regulator transcription factor [Bacillota bacterium]HQE02533.1 response regulator transcription factor [Bacillota bacterium]